MNKIYNSFVLAMLIVMLPCVSFASGNLSSLSLLLLDGPSAAIYSCQAGFLKDLNAASTSSNRVRPQFTNLGNRTVFFVDHPSYGTEPWVTDGTQAGTKLLKDITSGIGDGILAGLTSEKRIERVGNNLFFLADNGSSGEELWLTNGTTAGTRLVKDINGTGSSSGISNLTRYKNKLFFYVSEGNSTAEDEGLWVSDGTTAGTRLIKDVQTGTGNSSVGVDTMTVLNNTLYFIAETGAGGRFEELWKSNGTAAGTVRVSDIGSTVYNSDQMTNVSGKFYFLRSDGPSSNELWVSNGTAAGTLALKSFTGGAAKLKFHIGTYVDNPGYNGKLYFYGTTANQGYELWQSNGTVSGTKIVTDLFPGPGDSSVNGVFHGQAFNGYFYFQADDDVHGVELWRLNPDTSLTLIDLAAGLRNSGPEYFAANEDYLFFNANQSFNSGDELTILDKKGRVHQLDLYLGTRSSNPRYLHFRADGSLLFTTANSFFGPGVGLYLVSCPDDK